MLPCVQLSCNKSLCVSGCFVVTTSFSLAGLVSPFVLRLTRTAVQKKAGNIDGDDLGCWKMHQVPNGGAERASWAPAKTHGTERVPKGGCAERRNSKPPRHCESRNDCQLASNAIVHTYVKIYICLPEYIIYLHR